MDYNITNSRLNLSFVNSDEKKISVEGIKTYGARTGKVLSLLDFASKISSGEKSCYVNTNSFVKHLFDSFKTNFPKDPPYSTGMMNENKKALNEAKSFKKILKEVKKDDLIKNINLDEEKINQIFNGFNHLPESLVGRTPLSPAGVAYEKLSSGGAMVYEAIKKEIDKKAGTSQAVILDENNLRLGHYSEENVMEAACYLFWKEKTVLGVGIGRESLIMLKIQENDTDPSVPTWVSRDSSKADIRRITPFLLDSRFYWHYSPDPKHKSG
jgi:hypothetical protein